MWRESDACSEGANVRYFSKGGQDFPNTCAHCINAYMTGLEAGRTCQLLVATKSGHTAAGQSWLTTSGKKENNYMHGIRVDELDPHRMRSMIGLI